MANARAGITLPYPWIEGLTKEQQRQIYMDFMALGRAIGGGSYPTVLIATSGSSPNARASANYVCNGSNDSAQIENAITDCVSLGGGRVNFAEGTYHVTAPITVNLSGETVELHGQGGATITADDNFLTYTNGQTGTIMLTDLQVNAGDDVVETVDTRVISRNSVLSAGARVLDHLGGAGGGSAVSHIFQDNTLSADGDRVLSLGSPGHDIVIGNVIDMTNADYGVRAIVSTTGFNGPVQVINNRFISGGGGTGVSLAWAFFDFLIDCVVAGNQFYNVTTGVDVGAGHNTSVHGNYFHSCSTGVRVGTSGDNADIADTSIIHNDFHECSIGVVLDPVDLGNTDPLVGWNAFRGSNLTIGSGVSGARIVYNDDVGTYSDSGTGTILVNEDALLPPGGTVGQVLTKQSGTDFDTDWETFINEVLALVAAKGDLLVGLSLGVLGRLPAERSGQILMLDDTSPAGVKWGPKVTISESAPATPQPGDIWIDTT